MSQRAPGGTELSGDGIVASDQSRYGLGLRHAASLPSLILSFVVVGSAVMPGCEAVPPASEGEGEGEGEGEDEGEGEGEGEGEARGCESTGCGADERCGSIFGPTVDPACFAACTGGDQPCNTLQGEAGECRNIEGFGGPICRSQAADLEACGDDAGAGCAGDDARCVLFNDADLFPDGGICATGCLADADCGDASLGCTNDARFSVAGVVNGICVPVNDVVDAPCGRIDDELRICTGGLRCLRATDEVTGTCGEDAEPAAEKRLCFFSSRLGFDPASSETRTSS